VTTFHLVRHAEKADDNSILSGRTAGLQLSAAGMVQAGRLAAALLGESVNRIFSSPVGRAQETAETVGRALGLQVEIAESITEMDLGDWTGLTLASLETSDQFQRFNRFRGATRIPRGESMAEVQVRMINAMMRWRDEFPDGDILLVSHAEPIRAAVTYFAGAPLDFWNRFEIGLASLSTIVLGDDFARILRLNQCPAVDDDRPPDQPK
jgi:probable phosphoglycerate mutase